MDSMTTQLHPPPDADERSLVDDVRQLADEARAFAEAEAAYQKARAAFIAGEMKSIVITAVLAAVITIFAIFALAMGLILALTPLITAWGATAVVVGLLAVTAIFCIMSSGRGWKRMMAVLAEKDDRA